MVALMPFASFAGVPKAAQPRSVSWLGWSLVGFGAIHLAHSSYVLHKLKKSRKSEIKEEENWKSSDAYKKARQKAYEHERNHWAEHAFCGASVIFIGASYALNMPEAVKIGSLMAGGGFFVYSHLKSFKHNRKVL